MLGGDLPLGFADNENNIVKSPHGFQNFTTNGVSFIDIIPSGPQNSQGRQAAQEEETEVQRSEMTY